MDTCEGKFLGSIGHCTRWGVRDQLQILGEGGSEGFLINTGYGWVGYKPGLPEIELRSSSPVVVSVPEDFMLQACRE
jgi:hypothetical protein